MKADINWMDKIALNTHSANTAIRHFILDILLSTTKEVMSNDFLYQYFVHQNFLPPSLYQLAQNRTANAASF